MTIWIVYVTACALSACAEIELARLPFPTHTMCEMTVEGAIPSMNEKPGVKITRSRCEKAKWEAEI
jgi:hypothetical protein